LDEAAVDPVIVFMPEISKTHLGGTMRLGLRPTVFQANTEWSKVKQLYGNNEVIWERHRHRYEVNPDWVERIEKAGLTFTGRDEKGIRMQVAELKGEQSIGSHIMYILITILPRSPILCRHASTSRIYNTATFAFTFLSWLCRSSVWYSRRANRCTSQLRHASSRSVSEVFITRRIAKIINSSLDVRKL